MQALDATVVSSLALLCAATLMVQAGVGKKLLSWRPDPVRLRLPRLPRRRRR